MDQKAVTLFRLLTNYVGGGDGRCHGDKEADLGVVPDGLHMAKEGDEEADRDDEELER